VAFAEILGLVLVADAIGIGWTVLALVAAGVLGIVVIRVLGAASLVELQGALARREPPTGALVRGGLRAARRHASDRARISQADVVALPAPDPPLRTALLGTLWRRWPRGGGPGGGPTAAGAADR